LLIPNPTTGKVFFTMDAYDSQSAVYDRLSLWEPKAYRVGFSFTGNPDITGPDIVKATNFPGTDILRTNGGGMQFFIREIARIRLIGEPVPLGP